MRWQSTACGRGAYTSSCGTRSYPRMASSALHNTAAPLDKMGWVKSCIANLSGAHLCSGIRRRRKGWQSHLGAIWGGGQSDCIDFKI